MLESDRRATPTFATILYLRCVIVDVCPLPQLIVIAATISSNLLTCFYVFELVPDVFDVVAVHMSENDLWYIFDLWYI